MKDKKQLTKSETQVMKALWELPGSQGYSSEIMASLPEPKPAPTTLLTFLKILKDKGFVSSVKKGKGHCKTRGIHAPLHGRCEKHLFQWFPDITRFFLCQGGEFE